MTEKVTQVILTIAILVFSIKLFVKGYKDSKSDFEKVLYTMLSFAILFPLIVYQYNYYNKHI